jgi:uncharacterized protein (DUF934 family)
MPLLDRKGWKAETWRRLDGDAPATGSPLIVPFSDLTNYTGHSGVLGAEIANTVRWTELEPHFRRLALIAIAFPSFSDGRGFSIAKSLRNAGYRGTLRAVGPLIADQFAYALACGFDEVELPDAVAARQPIAIWLAAARAFGATYQSSHQAGGPSILEQRRAARGRAAE